MSIKKDYYYKRFNFTKTDFYLRLALFCLLLLFTYWFGFLDGEPYEKTEQITIKHKHINKVYENDSVYTYYIVSNGEKSLYLLTSNPKTDYDSIEIDSSYWVLISNSTLKQDIINKVLTK